jgi:flagellar hook-length control protein FliK
VTHVTFATPVASDDFAQAFGVQVSMLARDGVQQAELHLNPLETGPVSVQIAIDGNQARVDFGADAAATREAIEASLSQLAAALHDAGFTLSGGGVSQHAGDQARREGSDNSGPARHGRPAASPDAEPPRSTRSARVGAGRVDLYA